MQVKWTMKALTNLDDAVEYIGGNNPAAAKDVARQIWQTSQLLVLQPNLGRPGRVMGTRELVIPNLPYILPYIQKGNIVYILRVIHRSMMWPKKFS